MKYYYINGKIIDAKRANIHVSDLASLRGYGAFDFFRVLYGKPVFLKERINRFINSGSLFNLAFPFSKEKLIEQIQKLLAANKINNASVQMFFNRRIF